MPLIQHLDPDFVLSVAYSTRAPQLDIPSSESNLALRGLLRLLYDRGFATQVRAAGDLAANLLLFVRLKSYAFEELAEKDLVKAYEFGVSAKNTSKADRLRLISRYLTSPESVGGIGITPGKALWQHVRAIMPITEALNESSLVDDVKTHFGSPELTTGHIKETYGVQIALYFEFLKFYTTWLVALAVLGGVSFLKTKHLFSLTYSFVSLIWGVLFLVFWSRKQLYLVNFWGVQNASKVDEHVAELASLNKNFEKESSYSHKHNADGVRFVKQLAFAPVALAFTAVLVSYQLGCFVLEIFLSEIYDGPGKAFLTLLPTVLISVFVPILSIVYSAVASLALAWESHDNDYTRNNSVLIKTFVLNFLTSYVPLIITSFIYLPFAHLIEPNLGFVQQSITSSRVGSNAYLGKYLSKVKSQKDFQINQGRLNAQFFYFIVTNQVVQVVMKYILPLVLAPIIKFVSSKLGGSSNVAYEVDDDKEEEKWLQNVRNAILLPEYNVHNDFRGLVVQYGYLILFGPVWPLAPLVSIVFNLITFKLDTLKLTNGKYFRPPVPERADSIRPWDYAIFILTWFGSVISPIVTCFYRHGTKPPKTLGQFALNKASINVSSSAALILALLASEHVFFVLYFLATKLSDLFKSKVELDNDFVDNDIKLRRDFYSSKVKSSIKVDDDGPWADFTSEQALKYAEAVPGRNISRAARQKKQTEKEAATASLTSYQKGTEDSQLTNRSKTQAAVSLTSSAQSDEEMRRRYEQKQKELKQKQDELARRSEQNLASVKDKNDTVISTVDSSGQRQFSTIDDNSHFDPKKAEAPRENGVDESIQSTNTSESPLKDADATFSSTATGDDSSASGKKTGKDATDESSNGKVGRKKSSLKKLLGKKSK